MGILISLSLQMAATSLIAGLRSQRSVISTFHWLQALRRGRDEIMRTLWRKYTHVQHTAFRPDQEIDLMAWRVTDGTNVTGFPEHAPPKWPTTNVGLLS